MGRAGSGRRRVVQAGGRGLAQRSILVKPPHPAPCPSRASHRSGQHRVPGRVWRGCVATHAGDGDVEAVGAGKRGPGLRGRCGQPARCGVQPATRTPSPASAVLPTRGFASTLSSPPTSKPANPTPAPQPTLSSTTPVGAAGLTCRPKAAATPSSAPSSIITFAPPLPSSAGWNSRRTVPRSWPSTAFSRLAAAAAGPAERRARWPRSCHVAAAWQQEPQRIRQRGGRRTQQQRGGMAVVSARVHRSLPLAGKRQPALLLQGGACRGSGSHAAAGWVRRGPPLEGGGAAAVAKGLWEGVDPAKHDE